MKKVLFSLVLASILCVAFTSNAFAETKSNEASTSTMKKSMQTSSSTSKKSPSKKGSQVFANECPGGTVYCNGDCCTAGWRCGDGRCRSPEEQEGAAAKVKR